MKVKPRATQHGASLEAPEERPRVAHGVSRGVRSGVSQAPSGAKEMFSQIGSFYRPYGAWLSPRMTHGFRRGLLSVAAPQLKPDAINSSSLFIHHSAFCI